MSHLSALELRLSNEREYLRKAKTEGERQLREVWISQIEKEIAQERRFIETEYLEGEFIGMSDEEILKELAA